MFNKLIDQLLKTKINEIITNQKKELKKEKFYEYLSYITIYTVILEGMIVLIKNTFNLKPVLFYLLLILVPIFIGGIMFEKKLKKDYRKIEDFFNIIGNKSQVAEENKEYIVFLNIFGEIKIFKDIDYFLKRKELLRTFYCVPVKTKKYLKQKLNAENKKLKLIYNEDKKIFIYKIL